VTPKPDSPSVLFNIEYEIYNGGRKAQAYEVQDLVIERQAAREIREPQEGQSQHYQRR